MLADMHPPAPTPTAEIAPRAGAHQGQPSFGGFRLVAQAKGGTGTNDRGNSGPGRTGVPKDPSAPGASPGSGGTPDDSGKTSPPDEPRKRKRPRHDKGADKTPGSGGSHG
jgi:hypothetical protein